MKSLAGQIYIQPNVLLQTSFYIFWYAVQQS